MCMYVYAFDARMCMLYFIYENEMHFLKYKFKPLMYQRSEFALVDKRWAEKRKDLHSSFGG